MLPIRFNKHGNNALLAKYQRRGHRGLHRTLYYTSSVTEPIVASSNLLPLCKGDTSVLIGNKFNLTLLLAAIIYFATGLFVQRGTPLLLLG